MKSPRPVLDRGFRSLLHLVVVSDAEHQLGCALARDLCGHLFAKLFRCVSQRSERGIDVDVIAGGDEGHEESCSRGCGHYGREAKVVDLWIVELGQGVRECIEDLSSELQVFVMAPGATTTLLGHVAPKARQSRRAA